MFALSTLLLVSLPSLILSYHEYSLLDITCYISLASACLCSQHGFQCMIMIRFYRYTCTYLCSPLGFRITTRRGVLTPLDPHVQVLELGAYGFSRLLIRGARLKRGSPADHPELYPSRPPCAALEFSCYDSEPPFVLFTLVHPLYSRICAILVM